MKKFVTTAGGFLQKGDVKASDVTVEGIAGHSNVQSVLASAGSGSGMELVADLTALKALDVEENKVVYVISKSSFYRWENRSDLTPDDYTAVDSDDSGQWTLMSDTLTFVKTGMETGDSFKPVTNSGAGDYRVTALPSKQGSSYYELVVKDDQGTNFDVLEGEGFSMFALYGQEDLEFLVTCPWSSNIISSGSFDLGGFFPNGVSYSPDGNYMIAANFTSNLLQRYDISDWGNIVPAGNNFSIPFSPYESTYTPDGTNVLIADYNGKKIYRYDVSDWDAITLVGSAYTLPGSYNPTGCLIIPGTDYMLVADYGNKQIKRYDVSDWGSITASGSAYTLPGAYMPSGITCSQDGKYLLVSDNTAKQIKRYNISDWDNIKPEGEIFSLPGGHSISGLSLSSDGISVIVADSGASKIHRYNVGYVKTDLIVDFRKNP